MAAKRPKRRPGPAPQPRVTVDKGAPLVLSLDTSGPIESIGLAQGDLVLGTWSGRRPGRGGSGLVGRIEQVLAWCDRDFAELSAVAAVIGPGAFTGLRVGIATLRGLSRGLSIPSFGYSSEAAWAASLAGSELPVAVTLDARRKEVYGALLRPGLDGRSDELISVQLGAPQAWFEQLASRPECASGVVLCGDGARLYSELARDLLGTRAHIADAIPMGASVAWMARDSIRRLAAGEQGEDALRPLYMRDHDAAIARAAAK